MTQFRPLEKIDALSEKQRQQLAAWLQTGTLDNAIELVQQEFGLEIPRSTVNRFRKRCELADYLDTSPESARARAELINAAAAGKPNFCQATVDLLEKQIFELAHCHHDDGALDRLKSLFSLINKHKNTAVRERMAAVHERKAKIREEELALKKSLAAGKKNPQPNPPAVPSDELGALAATLDDIEARACRKFNLPLPDRSSRGEEAHDSGPTTTSPGEITSGLQSSDPTQTNPPAVSTVSPQPVRPQTTDNEQLTTDKSPTSLI